MQKVNLNRQRGEMKAARSTSLPGRRAPVQAREEKLRPAAEVNMDDNNA